MKPKIMLSRKFVFVFICFVCAVLDINFELDFLYNYTEKGFEFLLTKKNIG